MFARTFGNRRLGLFAALLLVAAVLVPAAPLVAEEADAATASDFDPGYIISDRNFYNVDSMSEAQIQSFLEARVPTCIAGNGQACLRDYRTNAPAQSAAECRGTVPAEANVLASHVIYMVARACGISPMVLIVTLQKEQGLVTATSPSERAYRVAMGYGCPDTAPCDSLYYGFANQVWRAARQFQIYAQRPQNFGHQVGFMPVRFHPNAACGAANVTIRNQPTASLYNYTPYQPNAAAMANLYGTGDACSSYGNRNFWRIYTDWFGSPTNDGSSPFGGVTAVSSTAASAVAVTGWAIDPDSRADGGGWKPITVGISVNVGDQYTPNWRILAYTTANKSGVTPSNSYPAYGPGHDFQVTLQNVPPGVRELCAVGINDPATAGQAWTFGCTTVTVAYCGGGEPCPTVDRLTGADRYAVAVGISQRAYPSTAPVVYVASGAGFPDALAAAPAAAKAGGPLLLTSPGELPAAVAAEIQRLNPAKIVIVGGPNSVSPQVEAALKAIKPDTTRLAGADRFAASRDVARTFGTTPDVYLATGLNFPDALTAGTLGAHQGRPVILVPGVATTVEPELLQLLQANQVQRITILGGPNSVSPQMEAALAGAGYAVNRVTGADRFAVSFAAQASIAASADTVYFASGFTYPDALTGSVLAAKNSAPLYLVRPDCLSADVINSMRATDVGGVTLLGGPNSLSARITVFTQCG